MKQFATFEEVFETIKEYHIQFGNLIFYNFDIPAIKKIKRKKFINYNIYIIYTYFIINNGKK
jgi:hypothetical protein